MTYLERLGGARAVIDGIVSRFRFLSALPHPSWGEAASARALAGWLEERGLSPVLDQWNNLYCDIPAAPGCEGAPLLILQGHLDMVCAVRPDSGWRPEADPVNIQVRDGWLRSDGNSSLGADNNLGNAVVLWLLDQDLSHGPLRLICTAAEEVGLQGASKVDPAWLAGARYLLNTDGFKLGRLVVSSAGGRRETYTRPLERTVPRYSRAVSVALTGGTGGHSGEDIHRGRANALAELAKLLLGLPEQGIAYQLADFHGGQARNAIPAAAQAVIAVQPEDMPRLQTVLEASAADLKASYNQVDPGLELRWKSLPASMSTIPVPDASALLGLMLTLPNGVHTMSPFAEGLVESSQNVGLLEHEPCTLRLSAMARSCDLSRAEELLTIDRLLSGAFGFSFEQGEHSPAWAVNPKSRLTPLACQVYRELTGSEMVVEPVHGALECGAFFEKNPHLDMIAIGPSLRDVHTPKETCDLESVHITAALLIELLRRLAPQRTTPRPSRRTRGRWALANSSPTICLFWTTTPGRAGTTPGLSPTRPWCWTRPARSSTTPRSALRG